MCPSPFSVSAGTRNRSRFVLIDGLDFITILFAPPEEMAANEDVVKALEMMRNGAKEIR